MPVSLPPALQLTLALTPWPLTPARQAQAAAWASQVTDWQEFLLWVKRQGVSGLVYANARKLPEGLIPAGVLEALNPIQRRAGMHNMRLLNGLGMVERAFSAIGLEYYTAKGPLLSHLLFSSLTLRPSQDLDIFVAPAEIDRAADTLAGLGFRWHVPAHPLAGRQKEAYAQHYMYNYSLIEPGRAFALELHWSLAEPYLFTPELTERWLKRGQTVDLPGLRTRTLAFEEYLAYCLLHGARHRWSKARHYADLLALLARPGLDWPRVLSAIREAGLERVATQGLLGAQALFGIELPAALQPILEKSPAVDFLLETALHSIAQREHEALADTTRRYRYDHRLKPGLAYQLAYLHYAAIEPADWEQVPLPDALFPCYYALRPLLWLWRSGKGRPLSPPTL